MCVRVQFTRGTVQSQHLYFDRNNFFLLQCIKNTLYGWIRKAKSGSLDIGCGERSPEESLNIAEENQQLRKRIKALEKENKRLSEMNEFLEDAAAFFAASRQKSGKNKD